MLRSDIIFFTPPQPLGWYLLCHGWRWDSRWGFYESSYSQMHGVSAMWNATMTHTPGIHRGVTMPWGGSQLYILSLEVSCALPIWHSSHISIFSWAKGSPGTTRWRIATYTCKNVNCQADLSVCVMRTQCIYKLLRVCWDQKSKKKTHVLSFIDQQPKALKVDIAPFPLGSNFLWY